MTRIRRYGDWPVWNVVTRWGTLTFGPHAFTGRLTANWYRKVAE